MNETFDQLTTTSVETQEQAVGLIEKLFTVAQPGAVFSEPVTAEGRTLITASEVNVGMGVGFGFGGGTAVSQSDEGEEEQHQEGRGKAPRERVELESSGAAEEEGEAAELQGMGEGSGMGGGGGGGGAASGRPIAVISISEEGVQVEPVVDATKIALAFFTTLGSMFFMLTKMRKAARG